MLAMAEEEARRRGCKRAVLYTISFQAPAFYARNGWRAFGEIPCDPPRHQPRVHDEGIVRARGKRRFTVSSVVKRPFTRISRT